MNRFLRIGCIWLGIFLVLAIFVDFMISSGLRKTDIRKYAAWNDIYRSVIDANVFILGSSETWCGYDTRIIDSMLHCHSYNLAVDGHGLKYQILRYETCTRFNTKPDVVIINLDYTGSFDANEGYGYEREQFFPFILDKQLIDSVAADKKITTADRVLPLYRYYGYRDDIESGIRAFFGAKSFKDGGLYHGFRANDYPWSPGSLELNETFLAQINVSLVQAFETFIENLKANDIQVILVEFPEYYRLRGKIDNINDVESIFRSISLNHSVPLLDFSHSEICTDSTLYYNPSHLNAKGSTIFTTTLCNKVDSLFRR